MQPSSRTPEGQPNRCAVCGQEFRVEPSAPPGDAPCPRCGSLAWFPAAAQANDALVSEVQQLDVATKHEAIQTLVRRLGDLGRISPEACDELVSRIIAREELGATAIGRGIAIPHAKHPAVPRTVGIVGYAARGIDFNSLDGEPVKIVVLLLSPAGQSVEHLRALAWISRTLRDAYP